MLPSCTAYTVPAEALMLTPAGVAGAIAKVGVAPPFALTKSPTPPIETLEACVGNGPETAFATNLSIAITEHVLPVALAQTASALVPSVTSQPSTAAEAAAVIGNVPAPVPPTFQVPLSVAGNVPVPVPPTFQVPDCGTAPVPLSVTAGVLVTNSLTLGTSTAPGEVP